MQISTLEPAVKKYVLLLAKLWRNVQYLLEVLNYLKFKVTFFNFCYSFNILHALFLIKLASSQIEQICILYLFEANLARIVSVLNLVAANHGHILLRLHLLFEFLEIKVLIDKHFDFLHAFILEGHDSTPAVVDHVVTTWKPLEEFILLALYLFSIWLEGF